MYSASLVESLFCPKTLFLSEKSCTFAKSNDYDMSKIIIHDRNEQFAEIVSMIQHTRNDVVRLANASLIDLYWKIGKYISNKIAASESGVMALSSNWLIISKEPALKPKVFLTRIFGE